MGLLVTVTRTEDDSRLYYTTDKTAGEVLAAVTAGMSITIFFNSSYSLYECFAYGNENENNEYLLFPNRNYVKESYDGEVVEIEQFSTRSLDNLMQFSYIKGGAN